MLTLRLTQHPEGQARYRVEVALEGEGLPRQTAEARFDFTLDIQEQENLRWYLEDFLQHPFDPAPAIAEGVEKRLTEMGTQLFRAVFESSDNARRLWARLYDRLNDTRVEIITSVEGATAIPWELIRDPMTDAPLALRARTFVRSQPEPAHPQKLPRTESGPIRILLVICRPGGGEDVPFRSVAARLIKGLSDQARAVFQLDVLRPPTFERLSKVLLEAQDRGQPYHVVHFDGHGVYLDVDRLSRAAEILRELSPLMLAGPRAGKHGYLAFENPQLSKNFELVDGSSLGKLLAQTDVPVLVLNACRSAHAEPPNAPLKGATEQSDPHSRVRAMGSLAQEVMDAGVAGVIAMRYNVYVVTAAQFVADLYATLARGSPLGQAATLGRKQLAAQPVREVGYRPLPLQDWPVPVVYEAAPIELFPKPKEEVRLKITLQAADSAPGRGHLDPALPSEPDVGFFGRDETLLALDRAFDTQRIVLLHAYAGSGKTATAAEFARWYALTGGVEGPVLFTSFERHKPLARVLDQIGQVFGPLMEQVGIPWLALPDQARRDVALQILQQIPVLWIWDNVEPVAGFPAGAQSVWSAAEQRELVDFLRAARDTQAKFLLTSRRDEWAWLGNLPRRIAVPPMPMQERVQLARGLAEKYGRRLVALGDRRPRTDLERWRQLTAEEDWRRLAGREEGPPTDLEELRRLTAEEDWRRLTEREELRQLTGADDWRRLFEREGELLRSGLESWWPLLQYTRGNPLTITVVVGQALRDRLKTREEIEAFVAKLRAGEAVFKDEMGEGRSKSLGASLSYGFEHAFSEEERKKLALLHLFQGFVDVDALKAMGHPEAPWCLPVVRGLTREEGISLLDRAAEVGLLTAHGRGYYSIHPALPWYFKTLFDQYYPPAPESQTPTPDSQIPVPKSPLPTPQLAFVEAMGELGNYYTKQYVTGHRDVIAALEAEEANLLHARQLARAHGWWWRVTSTMQGLRTLYGHMGRRAEWARLVNEVVPDFVDADSDGPWPGREEQWSLVTEYRVRLARQARQWAEAGRLQRLRVDWDRQRAAPALAAPPQELDDTQQNAIRTLAVSVSNLGDILREQGKPDCVEFYKEDYGLSLRIDDQPGAAVTAFNLGHAYEEIPALRDLDEAERWYRRSLELRAEGDRLGRSKCLSVLGYVARERFKEARAANKPGEELSRHFNTALQFYQQSLELIPPNAVDDLAVVHNQLGVIYHDAGDLESALPHYREAIRYAEVGGNLYKAAMYRYNVAVGLRGAGRLDEALLYAQEALRNYATYGEGAAKDVQRTQQLIALIEQAMKS